MFLHSIHRASGRSPMRPATRLAPLSLLALGGCSLQVLDPAGDVASQQAQILMISTALMLVIIIPVMALTVLFAWRYRASSPTAEHRPNWDHSTELELVIWSAPLLIIIMLGAITWISTHTLDPYRRLGRIAPGQAIAAGTKPLEIDVVALDWKWLFIYPEQGVAMVNQLALPVNREVRFRLTSSSVMNSFYVPALAGQIYTMPGMETKLHAVLNRTGSFGGFSANYSGAGFSGMHFKVAGMDQAGFDRFVAKARRGGGLLDGKAYQAFSQPTEDVVPAYWSAIDAKLFDRIVNICVKPGTPCMNDTMRHDMGGKPMGTMPPANANPPTGAEPKGALLRAPGEKGEEKRTGGKSGADYNQPQSNR